MSKNKPAYIGWEEQNKHACSDKKEKIETEYEKAMYKEFKFIINNTDKTIKVTKNTYFQIIKKKE